jgi:hypothetical protein
MTNETIFNVKNRSAGMVFYSIPEEGIRREFAPGETKRIRFQELEKLSYQSGGRELMQHFLQITSTEALENLNIQAEPEYYMNDEQVIDLIKNGSLDAWLDCLDFAPIGVMDLLKKYCIAIPLSDIEKRRTLKQKTGFDVDAALRHIEEERLEQEAMKNANSAAVVAEQKAGERRVKAAAENGANPQRRTTPKYKVVNNDK